ncbi:MAG: PAS domain-containing protein [Selenomonadaceae bacterium]|nr:PAS domain-containing protein [Selenomonadaceae bacterium]
MLSVLFSNELRHILGYNGVEEMPNTQEAIFALVHPDDLEYVSQELMAALSDTTGRVFLDVTVRMRHANGEYLWMRNVGKYSRTVLYDGSRIFYGVIVNINDSKMLAEM